MGQMNLTPLDDVLDKHFGKVGTPKRDAFERDGTKLYTLTVWEKPLRILV